MGEPRIRGIGLRLQVMPGNLCLPGPLAMLAAVAAWENVQRDHSVASLCLAFAAAEQCSPVAARRWLALCWGNGWVVNGRLEVTAAGWREMGASGDGVKAA